MGIIDWLLIAAIGAAVGLALRKCFGKDKNCSGDCGSCGCGCCK